jgi:hypothetical protein
MWSKTYRRKLVYWLVLHRGSERKDLKATKKNLDICNMSPKKIDLNHELNDIFI